MKIGAEDLTTDPLDVLPAATLMLDWSTSQNLPELEHSIGGCDGETNGHDRIEVSLASCCRETYDSDQRSGTLLARDIAPGTYKAALRFGRLPGVEMQFAAKPLQQTPAHLSAYYRRLSGDLTMGGKPLGKDATIQVRGGIGFAAKEGTEYHALLLDRVAEDEVIDVATCDGSVKVTVLADHAVMGNGRLDIDIPQNELSVRVIDTFTQDPVREATVRYAVLSRLYRPVIRGAMTTSAAGTIAMTNVPDREIRFTVTAPHYELREAGPVRVSDAKALEVQLVPRRAGHGRIVSEQRFEGASVAWFDASGKEVEHADAGYDGTFAYGKPHRSDEVMIVVSRSHPLWIAHSPELDPKATPELAFPNAPAVSVPESSGVAVGGLTVPVAILQQQKRLRRELIVLETGKIEVTKDFLPH
ncbi:MAG TPA: carboxypeptidase-like regulatory domain-containing protein [Thermoanaerobaculia bacterium]|nr:carboxypeptidase-like regulatory domain-containing protein [Thermoanaerobaculia bacterium]